MEQKNKAIILDEQGNKTKTMKRTGVQRRFGGTGNIENQDFDLGVQGKMPIFFRGARYPPPLGGSQDCLDFFVTCKKDQDVS